MCSLRKELKYRDEGKMRGNNELNILAEKQREIFNEVYNKIKDRNLTDRNLDEQVLNTIKEVENKERRNRK